MDGFVFLAVLFAAACHAGWNASIKRTLYLLATTALIALGAGAVALVFVPFVGIPALASWPWLVASIAIHLFYFAGLIESYRAGDLGQVYPIARGSAPLMTAAVTTFTYWRAARPRRLGRHCAARRRGAAAVIAGRPRHRGARPPRGRFRAVHRGDHLPLFGGRRHWRGSPGRAAPTPIRAGCSSASRWWCSAMRWCAAAPRSFRR